MSFNEMTPRGNVISMLDNQMKTQELDPQRSVSNIFLLDASDLANFPTANIGSGFNYFGTQGLLRSTGAFFLSCSSGLLSITAGADFGVLSLIT